MSRRAIVLVAALAAASCTRQQQQVDTTVTTTTGGTGSTGGAPAATGAPSGPYDPKKDPLVNPASLYEPLPADPSLVAEGETLYRNLDATPRTINPLFMASTYEFYMAEQLFSGPFTFDAKMQWATNPDVTESVTESEDHLQWVVKLKPGMTWQDGHPFGAEDICYSYRKIMDPAVPVDAVRTGTEEITACEVLDPLTYRLTHRAALPTNKWNALFPNIPKHLYEKDEKNNPDLKSGDYYIDLNRNVVGNGTYKLVEWVENERLVFERWEEFWGRKPHFKRVVFRIIPDANTLLLTFNKGDVDEMRITPQQFATQTSPGSDFDRIGGVKAHGTQWLYDYIGYNMDGSNPFFSDVRVRRAMTHACDVDRFIRDVTYNLYQPGRGHFHPESRMYDPAIVPFGYDLDEAARLLDEAGWTIDPSREGWRHKVIDGKPVKFSFTALIPQGSQTAPQVAAIWQEDLRSIGVELNTTVIEFATMQERMRKHEVQCWFAAWGTGTDPDTSWNIWHSSEYDPTGKTGRNYGGYKNERVDELFRLARHEFDETLRMQHYQELGRLMYEEQPYTWLWYRALVWGFHERIHGVTTSPRGVFNFDPAERAWWVPASQAKYVTASTP